MIITGDTLSPRNMSDGDNLAKVFDGFAEVKHEGPGLIFLNIVMVSSHKHAPTLVQRGAHFFMQIIPSYYDQVAAVRQLQNPWQKDRKMVPKPVSK